MPPKRKEEIEVTTVGRVNSLPTNNSQSSSPPCYTTAHVSQNNSTRQNSFSFEGTSFHQEQPIYNSNSSHQLSAVPSSHVISLSTSTLAPGIETINPQTSVIITEDGDMPMQEDVRLNIALVSAQTANGSQIECPTPNGELPPRILYDGVRRRDHLSVCVPLYQAAIKGEWKAAKLVIDKDPHVVRVRINRKLETALHIAAAAKRTAFVKELVQRMTEDDLALQNKDGNTAICFAAASGIVEIAKVMVEKNERLPMIRGKQGKTPLYMAALFGHREMVSYLYSVTTFGSLSHDEKISLLLVTISADLYDLALKILEKDQSLATAQDTKGETALHVLARKPSTIANTSQLSIWKRSINSCFKWIYHEDLMRTLAHRLVKKLWEHVLELQDSEISKLIREPSRLLFDAAELGSLEFLIILIDSYPDLIWKIDQKNRSLFHIAVLNRHENIFNLIYEIGAIKDLIAAYKDENNNNILHLAANLAPLSRLQIVSGAALQMQRELLWFKGVEKIVPPSYIKMKNSDNQTPKDLFTEKHKELLKEGEKWMKSTATSCMLVATLIATVVFAAIFTLPGGPNNDTGVPLFLGKRWFLIFVISDAVALFSSSASIVTFLSILTSRYAENDFLVSLPARLMFGLSALFVSIATMVIAYGAAISMIYDHKHVRIPIVIVLLACVPVTLFAWQHFHLWADTISSTYWSRFLFQPKHRLYH
ncbi:ankyrin repeat-containing protein At5g02620-like isoform X2 [Quercus robur]|uniref:ankyrin repeat-containing protein At5g02620-like isoform X2 n=1 Tax=Quercus robur TaxID=38942 RepID=UPI00216317F1|nr:ankyrin repeat-containing protein At5g02620-like isoform X2 [Quercus robur]